jgi:hypothetical protein
VGPEAPCWREARGERREARGERRETGCEIRDAGSFIQRVAGSQDGARELSFRAIARKLADRNTTTFQDFSLRYAPFEMTNEVFSDKLLGRKRDRPLKKIRLKTEIICD